MYLLEYEYFCFILRNNIQGSSRNPTYINEIDIT